MVRSSRWSWGGIAWRRGPIAGRSSRSRIEDRQQGGEGTLALVLDGEHPAIKWEIIGNPAPLTLLSSTLLSSTLLLPRLRVGRGCSRVPAVTLRFRQSRVQPRGCGCDSGGVGSHSAETQQMRGAVRKKPWTSKMGRTRRPVLPVAASEKATGSPETEHLPTGRHEMIEDAYAHRLEALWGDEPARDQLVGLGDLSHAARMSVCKNHGGGIALKRLLHHLSGIHGGAVDRSPEKLHEVEYPVPIVQKQKAKRFKLAGAESECQEIAHRLWRREGSAAPDAPREMLAGRSDDVLGCMAGTRSPRSFRVKSAFRCAMVAFLDPGRDCPGIANSTPQRRGHRLAAGDSASSASARIGREQRSALTAPTGVVAIEKAPQSKTAPPFSSSSVDSDSNAHRLRGASRARFPLEPVGEVDRRPSVLRSVLGGGIVRHEPILPLRLDRVVPRTEGARLNGARASSRST